jgi:hypothetical protein
MSNLRGYNGGKFLCQYHEVSAGNFLILYHKIHTGLISYSYTTRFPRG